MHKPLVGILDHHGKIFLGCRPHDGRDDSRSAIMLLELKADDEEGDLFHGLCWCAPLKQVQNTTYLRFKGWDELSRYVSQYILMLPRLDDSHGGTFVNSYYIIGQKWIKRTSSGKFVMPSLSSDVFEDWLSE